MGSFYGVDGVQCEYLLDFPLGGNSTEVGEVDVIVLLLRYATGTDSRWSPQIHYPTGNNYMLFINDDDKPSSVVGGEQLTEVVVR